MALLVVNRRGTRRDDRGFKLAYAAGVFFLTVVGVAFVNYGTAQSPLSTFHFDPKLRQLARNLPIPDTGDCLAELRAHALANVRQMICEWTVDTIDELRMVVAERLSVKIEYIDSVKIE